MGVPACRPSTRGYDKRRRGRRPAGPGDRAARNDATTVLRERRVAEVRAHHRAAQPDPAGAGAALLLRPQPLHVGAHPSCRRTPSIHDAPPPVGVRGLCAVPGWVRWSTRSRRASPHTSPTSRPSWSSRRRSRPRHRRRSTVPAPPLKSRRLETRLMMVLGAGFGLGVALDTQPAVRRAGAGSDHRGAGGGRRGRPAAHGVGGRHPRSCCTTGRCWTAGSARSPPLCGRRSRSGSPPGCWPPRRR